MTFRKNKKSYMEYSPSRDLIVGWKNRKGYWMAGVFGSNHYYMVETFEEFKDLFSLLLRKGGKVEDKEVEENFILI